MAIDSFLSRYAEGLFVLFCSILRARDRNPSRRCRRAVPPPQNSWSSAAHQPTSAHEKAAVILPAALPLLLSRGGMEGQRGGAAPRGTRTRSCQAPAPCCPQPRGQEGPAGTAASRQATSDALRCGLRGLVPFLPPAFSAVFPSVWQRDVSCLP